MKVAKKPNSNENLALTSIKQLIPNMTIDLVPPDNQFPTNIKEVIQGKEILKVDRIIIESNAMVELQK